MIRSWEDSIKKATTPANFEWNTSLDQLHTASTLSLFIHNIKEKNRLKIPTNICQTLTSLSVTSQTAHKCSTSSYVIVYRVYAANEAFGAHIQIDNQRDTHPYWGNEFTGTLTNMTCTQISQRAEGSSIPTRSPIVIVIAHFASVSPVYLPQHTKMPSEWRFFKNITPNCINPKPYWIQRWTKKIHNFHINLEGRWPEKHLGLNISM